MNENKEEAFREFVKNKVDLIFDFHWIEKNNIKPIYTVKF